MKRIESKKDIEKKRKRNQMIIGVAMVALLVLSTAGFALINMQSNGDQTGTSGTESRTYKGLEFFRQDGLWITQINQKVIVFSYLPDEIEDVEIETSKTLTSYTNQPLYVVNGKGIKEVLGYNLMPDYVLRINDACISEANCANETYPIKSCLTDNIIIYEEGETTSVTQDNNCIIITGDNAKGTDKFLQRILGLA